jgi:hypothetical protein
MTSLSRRHTTSMLPVSRGPRCSAPRKSVWLKRRRPSAAPEAVAGFDSRARSGAVRGDSFHEQAIITIDGEADVLRQRPDFHVAILVELLRFDGRRSENVHDLMAVNARAGFLFIRMKTRIPGGVAGKFARRFRRAAQIRRCAVDVP